MQDGNKKKDNDLNATQIEAINANINNFVGLTCKLSNTVEETEEISAYW